MTTVLVVEDEMEIARIVRDYLSDAGFEVIVVATAIRRSRASGAPSPT